MRKGICKLCKEEKELCEKSHIIPNHSYSPLKDGNQGFLYIDGKTINESAGKQRRFTGEFERGILCKDCESRISEFETYGANFVFNRSLTNIIRREFVNQHGLKFLETSGSGYDYVKFKLYLLTILWRAAISSRPFFSNVLLSVDDEENMRQMIINNNPGEIKDYPCILVLPALMHCGEGFDFQDIGLLGCPVKKELDGFERFDFLINGCQYNFFITKVPDKLKLISVQKDKLIILYLTEEQTLNRRQDIIKVTQDWMKK